MCEHYELSKDVDGGAIVEVVSE